MLYFIANPTTVNQIRLDAGIKRDLKPEDFVFVRVRKSNRLKSSTQKRQFDNLEGLTSPCKRKRKSRSTDKPVKKPAAVDESSADMDTEVGTSSGADEPATDAAAEDTIVVTSSGAGEPATDAAVEDAAVGTPSGAGEPATDAAAEDTTVGTPSGQTDNSSAESSSTTENTQIGAQPSLLLPCPLPTIAELLHPENAIHVATSVLLELVNRHDRIGRFGNLTEEKMATTNPSKIRSFTNQLARLEYEAAVYSISKRNAKYTANRIQFDSDESAYWDIILKGVKFVDPATLLEGSSKGPLDGISAAEKAAAKTFMISAGLGTSPENQRLYRNFWKALSDMRRAGVEMITCYRTPEFTEYCKTYPKRSDISLVDTIVSWEKVYGPQIDQLESRVFEYHKGDFSGKSRLMQKHVAERLKIAESSWNDASNEWYSNDEEAAFKLTTAVKANSSKSLASLFNDRANTQQHWNKALFISLLPNGDNFLDVCPTIPVFPGDFLGIYSGTVRFSEKPNASHGIPGPEPKLWLDYSQSTGTLNQMQVSKPDDDANVHLRWEAVNEQNETGPCESWRVLVIARKAIMPFQPLVRTAPRNEQYLLHQGLGFAKRGFMKSTLVTKLKT